MKKLLVTAFVLFASLAAADNTPVRGLTYDFKNEGRQPDRFPEPYSCGASAPGGVAIRYTSSGMQLLFNGSWISQSTGGFTDDGGAYGVWTAARLGVAGQVPAGTSVTVHLWYPDDAPANGRFSLSSFDLDGDSCGDAWRYPRVQVIR